MTFILILLVLAVAFAWRHRVDSRDGRDWAATESAPRNAAVNSCC